MNWFDGYGFGEGRRQRPPPQARPQAPPEKAWAKGAMRKAVEVCCCPECGDTHVKISNGNGTDTVARMVCVNGHAWKDERTAPRLRE